MFVELYGIPRLRAGRDFLELEASTLGEALLELASAFPGLAGTVVVGDRLQPAFKASINSERFVEDPGEPLRPTDLLILLSADVGG